MTEEIEIEFKNLLTEKEYQTLLYSFNATENELFTQINSYFDTPDWDLKKLHAGLRIRLLPDSAELTLKTPFENHLLETTDSLSLMEAEKLISDGKIKADGAVGAKLKSLNISPERLRLLGTLKTTRFERQTSQGLFVLDKSYYGNEVDYELEFEVPDYSIGKIHFDNFLEKHQIPLRPAKNKIARMIDATFKK